MLTQLSISITRNFWEGVFGASYDSEMNSVML